MTTYNKKKLAGIEIPSCCQKRSLSMFAALDYLITVLLYDSLCRSWYFWQDTEVESILVKKQKQRCIHSSHLFVIGTTFSGWRLHSFPYTSPVGVMDVLETVISCVTLCLRRPLPAHFHKRAVPDQLPPRGRGSQDLPTGESAPESWSLFARKFSARLSSSRF